MRVAQVAPLAESVPPKLYGGTERVVSWLTEELVRQRHDVTLFASGDSNTQAKLVECVPLGLRLAGVRDHTANLLVMLDLVRRLADDFDIIHFHTDLLHFPLFRDIAHKCVTTLHGRLDLPDLHPVYSAFPEMHLVSISDDQRKLVPSSVNWGATIHHGLPINSVECLQGKGGYLAFLGRISPEKRPDRAIEIAKRAGVPLKIAAKVDAEDQNYFDRAIRPLLGNPLVEFVGEIDDARKPEFLGNAVALLFPIDWPEPFGLVMIESMAVGTPVVAWPCGSVREVIDPDITGVIVESIDDAVAALAKVRTMSRQAVRQQCANRFTSRRMANDYVALYNRMLATHWARTVELPKRLLNDIELVQPSAGELAPAYVSLRSRGKVDSLTTR